MAGHDEDLDWLYRRDPATVAKDAAKAEAEGIPYVKPSLPASSRAPRPRATDPSPATRPRIAPAPGRDDRPSGPGRPVPADAPVRRPLPERGHPRAAAVARPVGPRRRPRWGRILLLGSLVLLLILGLSFGYLVTTPLGAWHAVARVDDSPKGKRPGGHPGTAILLVGSDSRGGLTPAEMAEFGVTGDDGELDGISRTDSMMLLYTPPSGQSVLISIPRDSWTAIPGHGEAKVNAAFALGGPELLIQTIEQRTGFRIDGYAEIGFAGFARVVKALGGLPMCLDKPVAAEGPSPEIPAGCQTLTPAQSLWFVRARHNDLEGDIGRAARQRQFMAALMKQMTSRETVMNRDRFKAVADAGAKGLALGQDTGIGDVWALANGMKSMSGGTGASLTLPIADPDGWSDDGQSIVILDDARMKKLFAQLNKGDTSNMDAYR